MRSALAILLLGALACGGAPTAPATDRLPANEPSPLVDGAGSFAQTVAGRVAIVDLWAAWCAPCRAAIPQLRALARELGPRRVVVVGVNVGEARPEAADAVEKLGMTYPIFSDPDFAFSDAVGARSVPTLLVIDRDGRIAHRGQAVDAALRRAVDALLEAPSP